MEDRATLDPELFRLFSQAVKDGLEYVKYRKEQGGYIGHYIRWPELSWREHGLPDFADASVGSGPIDYKDAFGGLAAFLGRWPGSTYEEFDSKKSVSWNSVYEYFRSNELLAERSFINDEFGRTTVELFIERLIDRYIHMYSNFDFDKEAFFSIYKPIEEGLLSDKLTINILVPILMLTFEENEIALDEGAKVIRMSKEIQLARAPNSSFSYGRHPLVESSATHALLLTNYWMPNGSLFSRYLDRNGYPLPTIDSFFAALRMTILKDWIFPAANTTGRLGSTYEANLPSLEASPFEYPASFEDGCWNDEVPIISSDQIKEGGKLFRALEQLSNEKSKFNFAVKRFNMAHLRESEEDTTVDASIGMEALLSDSNEEMTHKLAMRIASLSVLDTGKLDPTQIMQEVKDVYRFRSAVVHGDLKNIERRREVVTGGKKILTATLALNILAMLLRVLANNPTYLTDVKTLDRDLLMGRFRPV